MSPQTHKRLRAFLPACALTLALAVFGIAAFKSQTSGRAGRPALEEAPGIATRAPLSPPAPVSAPRTPAERALEDKINGIIAASPFAAARWGVCVINTGDGRVIYGRASERSFTPASNMKLYTTAAALELLGADYRWRTSVYAAAPPDSSGNIAGDLILYGRGAPDLALSVSGQGETNALAQFADDLYRRGVRRVRGDVVGDESYFRGEPLGDGWLWNDVQWYFGAEVSALSVGGNEVILTITPADKPDAPADIKIEPVTEYVSVVNETNTVARSEPTTIGINRGLSDNVVRVWGDFPAGGRGFKARLAVHQPALWAADRFRAALRARGILVEGDARALDTHDRRKESGFEAQRAVELTSSTSKSLFEIARATNKESLNLEAELILRTLGKERGATVPDPDPRRMMTRGDDAAGLAVIRRWLEQNGIGTSNLALHDGSGLSRLDLVTPETTARLLALMTKSPVANIFRETLPVAGRDGTLRSRFRSPASSGRILAKTGTLTYTTSLSGYVIDTDGDLLAFSIMCNDELAPGNSQQTVDAIASLLAQFQRQ